MFQSGVLSNCLLSVPLVVFFLVFFLTPNAFNPRREKQLPGSGFAARFPSQPSSEGPKRGKDLSRSQKRRRLGGAIPAKIAFGQEKDRPILVVSGLGPENYKQKSPDLQLKLTKSHQIHIPRKSKGTWP